MHRERISGSLGIFLHDTEPDIGMLESSAATFPFTKNNAGDATVNRIVKCLICILASTISTLNLAEAGIKIGIAGPLSGGSLTTGEQQDIGARTAVADLNKNGGVLGQEIVIFSVDDACDPEQAKAAARQLVSEGVIFVNGHVCSGASLAASKIYEEAGVIMMSPSSTNPKVTDEGGPNVFRVIGRDDQQGVVAGRYLSSKHGNSKIAIIHDDSAYGRGLAEFTKLQLNSDGVSEAIFESYVPEQADYNTLINKLADSKIDVLYIGGYLSDVSLILRQAKKKMPELLLVSGDTLVNSEFLDIAGEAGVGSIFTFGPDIRLQPEAKAVVAAIRDDEGFEPAGFTLYSYGAVQAWAQAVEMAKSLETGAVVRALRLGKFDTTLGEIGFDEKGDVTGLSAFVLYKYGEDDYELVK